MTHAAAQVMHTDVWDGCLLLDGWVAGSGDRHAVRDKASGETLASVALATAADVATAGRLASERQKDWMQMPFEQRAAIVRRAAALIEANRDELATWIMRETGAIRAKAEMELHMAAGILHESAALVTTSQGLLLPSDPGRTSMARRVPRGVVGVIAPFNFPLILAIRAVAPALATGNAVVLKPDPQTAVAGGVLIARVLEMAGLPRGLLSVLPGASDVGEALCSDDHVAMIAFTGSTAAGRRVGELAGRHLKKVSLELGGKNALIVRHDADLDKAAACTAFGAWMHQGQICMSAGRILVHESLAADLVEQLVAKADNLTVGDPMSDQVALGPMINAGQVERLHAIVHESIAAGAGLRAGGRYDGLFYRPTVLDAVRPGMRAFGEEFFGPVAAVTSFADDDEALALAGDTDYGLSAAVISRDVGRALALGKRLNTGLLHINDQTVADEPWIPFGGQGASGNGSRAGGPANIDEFTQWQWLTIKDEPPGYPF